MSQFNRTTIVHEGYDIAYTSLWNLFTSGNIDEEARGRGYSEQDIVRIHVCVIEHMILFGGH